MSGLVSQMSRNLMEALDNYIISRAYLSEDDLIAIGKDLHEQLFNPSNPGLDWDEDVATEAMDEVRIIIQLAAGVPTCLNCGASKGTCECGEDARIVWP